MTIAPTDSQPTAAAIAVRAAAALTLGVAAVGLLATGAAAATVRPLAVASPQDVGFVTSNGQTNLAEIALGKLGLQRAGDSATKALAQMTLTDHERLQTQLTAAAKANDITVPTAPNAMQQAVAATLAATPSSAFDLAYAKAEQAGHLMAIPIAKTETTAGSDTQITAYAAGYIPVATEHLDMADAEVTALTGASPTSVSAGTGGHATTDTGSATGWEVGAGAGLVLIAASGATLLRRRRSDATSH